MCEKCQKTNNPKNPTTYLSHSERSSVKKQANCPCAREFVFGRVRVWAQQQVVSCSNGADKQCQSGRKMSEVEGKCSELAWLASRAFWFWTIAEILACGCCAGTNTPGASSSKAALGRELYSCPALPKAHRSVGVQSKPLCLGCSGLLGSHKPSSPPFSLQLSQIPGFWHLNHTIHHRLELSGDLGTRHQDVAGLCLLLCCCYTACPCGRAASVLAQGLGPAGAQGTGTGRTRGGGGDVG